MAGDFVRRSTLRRTIDMLNEVYRTMGYADTEIDPTVEQLYAHGFKVGLQLAIDAFEEVIVPQQERLAKQAEQQQREFDDMIKNQQGE